MSSSEGGAASAAPPFATYRKVDMTGASEPCERCGRMVRLGKLWTLAFALPAEVRVERQGCVICAVEVRRSLLQGPDALAPSAVSLVPHPLVHLHTRGAGCVRGRDVARGTVGGRLHSTASGASLRPRRRRRTGRTPPYLAAQSQEAKLAR
jgi:hypothetical protein